MSIDNERSLADEPTTVVDESGEVFDPTTGVVVPRGPLTTDEFLAGVRAQRRAVRIRPNLHLLPEMERLVDEIDAAPAGTDVDDLVDAYESTKEQFLHSARWVVEQSTPERRRYVRRQAAEELGIELREDGEHVKDDDADLTKASAVEAHVIADHVIEPEGVTAAQIRALYEASPGEYRKVDVAVSAVQRVLDEKTESLVLRDFSSRRSGKTQRSSKH